MDHQGAITMLSKELVELALVCVDTAHKDARLVPEHLEDAASVGSFGELLVMHVEDEIVRAVRRAQEFRFERGLLAHAHVARHPAEGAAILIVQPSQALVERHFNFDFFALPRVVLRMSHCLLLVTLQTLCLRCLLGLPCQKGLAR